MRRWLPILLLFACGPAAVPSDLPPATEPVPAVAPASAPPRPTRLDPSQLQAGRVRLVLSPEQRDRIEVVQKVLAEVDPSPLEQWLDDFSRDEHPDSEIEMFEAMAAAYTAFIAGKQLTPEQRNEVYGALLQRSGAPTDEVLRRFAPQHLTHEQLREVLAAYRLAPRPITVTPLP